MAKTKSKKAAASPLPLAPWIYLNQHHECAVESPADVALALQALIPKASVIPGTSSEYTGGQGLSVSLEASTEMVTIIKDSNVDSATAASLADRYHKRAIAKRVNFASVNISYSDADFFTSPWGTNHLEIAARGLTTKEIAKKIYRWLFKVFAVAETLHLIPEKEMLAVDDKSFPGYAYCAIADSRKHKKDAKIQFVALITSKPAVGADGRLHWTVTDRTGTANFYFQYRGASSKYTWDWVLALQPGDRKALPRMPMVKVKEKMGTTLIKAPFRGVGFVVGGTGAAVKGIGQGLCHIGKKMKLGKSSKWVPEADVKDGKVSKSYTAPGAKEEIKIFNDSGEKLWKWQEGDDDASTTAGSVYDKELC